MFKTVWKASVNCYTQRKKKFHLEFLSAHRLHMKTKRKTRYEKYGYECKNVDQWKVQQNMKTVLANRELVYTSCKDAWKVFTNELWRKMTDWYFLVAEKFQAYICR